MIKIIKKIDFDGREKIKAHLLERGRKKKKASRKKKKKKKRIISAHQTSRFPSDGRRMG
jgi:hypothetical protein